MERFKDWKMPEFNETGVTKWNWMCQNHQNLTLGKNTDIGAFTYINAKFGVVIEEDAQIGSHCSIYSESTIDDKKGKVLIRRNARVGAHSVIMPGVTVGEDAVVAACSFVNKDVPRGAIWGGVPAKALSFSNNKLPDGILYTAVPEKSLKVERIKAAGVAGNQP